MGYTLVTYSKKAKAKEPYANNGKQNNTVNLTE
jgi:hypothetical protein